MAASVTQFIAALKQDEALRQQAKAAPNPAACIQLAQSQGYSFTAAELQTELGHLSEEEVAELVNPGIAPRRHIQPS